MENNRGTNIQALSLITSCGCNLNCSYCRIAQSKHEGAAEMQKCTIQALQDGSFLANVNTVLNRLNQSTQQISSLAFWGQEPTLTLNYITEDLDRWFEYFPRWQYSMFSTNTIAHMDKILDFIKTVDEKCKVEEFFMNIQFSYDGDYATDNLRKGSSSTIHDNIKWLIEQLNTVPLKKVRLTIMHHGVMSLDLIDKLQTPQEVADYSNHMFDWGHEFNTLNLNKHVHLSDEVDIALENPVEASAMQGLKLASLCSISDRLNPFKKHSFIAKAGSVDPVNALYKGYFTPFNCLVDALHNFGFENLDQCLDAIIENPVLRNDIYNQFNHILYCGNGNAELKFLWNGTLINCQNHMFETDVNLIHDTNELANAVKKGLATHNYFVNGLTASEQDLDKYFSLFYACKNTSFEFTVQNVVTLMNFLVITNQIDPSYRDRRKLVKHSIILAIIGCCSYNNQVMTGSIFMRHTGYLRLMCNGFLDLAIEEYNEMQGGRIL